MNILVNRHQVMCQVGNYCLAKQLLANQYYLFQSKYNIIDSMYMYTADNAAHLIQSYSSSELQVQIMLEVLQNYYLDFDMITSFVQILEFECT
jgi:hypothetical protein